MPYTWRATYKDGTVLDASKDRDLTVDGLDRKQLERFELVSQAGASLMTLHLDPGQRLIYRRRVMLAQGAGKPSACHLIGWQQTVGGENVQSILYVFEDDGRVEMAGRFRENHPFFYPPQLRRFEVED
jgi:hypothetical protein